MLGNARDERQKIGIESVKVGERYPVRRTSRDRKLPEWLRASILRRDHYRCVFCGAGGLLEVDHIVPWSAGGTDDRDNLRTLCKACNQDRSNYRLPGDQQRRPVGRECIRCNPELVGEPTTTVYCCGQLSPGTPRDPRWHPDLAGPGDQPREVGDALTDMIRSWGYA